MIKIPEALLRKYDHLLVKSSVPPKEYVPDEKPDPWAIAIEALKLQQ
jgi:hypothetical protein